jgi:hypothetical protein
MYGHKIKVFLLNVNQQYGSHATFLFSFLDATNNKSCDAFLLKLIQTYPKNLYEVCLYYILTILNMALVRNFEITASEFEVGSSTFRTSVS